MWGFFFTPLWVNPALRQKNNLCQINLSVARLGQRPQWLISSVLKEDQRRDRSEDKLLETANLGFTFMFVKHRAAESVQTRVIYQ